MLTFFWTFGSPRSCFQYPDDIILPLFADGSKRKITSKDIKEMLNDAERMKGFDAFRDKYMELKRTAVNSDLKGETFTIRQCPNNVVFIPGTLIVGK